MGVKNIPQRLEKHPIRFKVGNRRCLRWCFCHSKIICNRWTHLISNFVCSYVLLDESKPKFKLLLLLLCMTSLCPCVVYPYHVIVHTIGLYGFENVCLHCTLSCLSLSAFVLLLKHEYSRIAGESVSPCTSTSVIASVQTQGVCVCVFVRARAAVRVISNKCSVCSASPWQRRGRHAAPLLCLCGEINAAFFSCCEAATKQLFKTNS